MDTGLDLAPLTQGGRANSNGTSAENTIFDILARKGHTPERQRNIGFGIYGTALRADIYLSTVRRYPDGLIIESKWQESLGSVDEKLPYLVENIRICYPCPTIIVVGGGGMRPLALAWLKRQADGTRLIAVFTLEEFLTWANRTL